MIIIPSSEKTLIAFFSDISYILSGIYLKTCQSANRPGIKHLVCLSDVEIGDSFTQTTCVCIESNVGIVHR